MKKTGAKESKKARRQASFSNDARRCAAIILEVLAGSLKPVDAATALGVCLNRYYQLEDRALGGFVAACEPVPHGRSRSPQKEVDLLKKKCEHLEQESNRFQALARAAQKTVGLNMERLSRMDNNGNGKKRRRRPAVRALKAAEKIRIGLETEKAAEGGNSPAAG